MKVKFLDFKNLKDFPSGSGIEYYYDRVYLVGDDAPQILMMDKRWNEMERIPLFESEEARIPKKTKTDLEATTVVHVAEIPHLLILGSGSREHFRNKALLVDLNTNAVEEHDLEVFYTRLKNEGIIDLNIEAATSVDDLIVLCNRGNKNTEGNCFIVTQQNFWKNQHDAEIRLLKTDITTETANPGLSGLAYSERHDMLVFTASTEDTGNTYDDGKIGPSYLGIIEGAYHKLYRKKIKANELINLSEADENFKNYKIESVCIQSEKSNRMRLHLVADNDTGESFLFKLRLKF